MNARHSISRHPLRARPATCALAGAAALGLLTLTACGSGGAAADDGRVDVAASFYPMEYLAEEIGGKHVDVTSLTSPGAEPHDLELTPRQVGELGEADLVVYLKGLQPAVDEAVAQSEVEHTAEAGSYTSLEKHSEHGEHGEQEHGEQEHGAPEGHEHTMPGGGDPHVWLDPVRYAAIAKGVGKELATTDPEHAETYRKNTADLVTRLEKLDEDFRTGLRNRKTDTFVTTHAAFGYLADRYHLHEESISGIDPASGSISAEHIKDLHRTAEEDGVRTVFSGSRANDDAAQTLAEDLGLRTDVLDTLETAPKSDTQDYLSRMHHNLQALRTALGAQ
ncbi:metal ABC transporter substrate-binding protein [Streptomyces sp. TR06-5]|uniref:metal ABC transporter substrate-binding protein n=1 Tax=unclassified Streptomyces TaxID=2593676 RepID=UPI0039A2A9F7